MLKEIIISIQSYIDAHYFIRQHRLWKWIAIPGIISTLLFIIGMYFFLQSTTGAVAFLNKQIGIQAWLDQQHSEGLNFLFLMAGLILQLILVFFYFSLFKYLFLILCSPVFAYLSEKTSSILEDREHSFSWPEVLKDAGRGIKLALRNALWQTVYLLALFLAALIPVVGWVTPLVAIFLECYYFGFSMMDYSCARNKLTASESIEYIGNQKGLAVGNGIMFLLMHGAVIIGWVLAPSYAVVAANLSLHKMGTKP